MSLHSHLHPLDKTHGFVFSALVLLEVFIIQILLVLHFVCAHSIFVTNNTAFSIDIGYVITFAQGNLFFFNYLIVCFSLVLEISRVTFPPSCKCHDLGHGPYLFLPGLFSHFSGSRTYLRLWTLLFLVSSLQPAWHQVPFTPPLRPVLLLGHRYQQFLQPKAFCRAMLYRGQDL